MDRLKQLTSHFTRSPKPWETKSPDDVVITLAIRSPLCKSWKGALKDTRSDELLTSMLKATISRMQIPPGMVQDICVGTVLPKSPGYEARASALAAGFPETTPTQVINRFCSSGLMAVTTVANQIRAAQIEIGLAVGVESMSFNKDEGAPPPSEEILAHPIAKDCLHPMGWTSENVSNDFSISREDMDVFAAISQQRAAHAASAGLFDAEIVPIEAFQKDPATGERKRVLVEKDDGIRPSTTAASLSKIRPAFPQWGGRTTGGNASQITDGAASVLLMTRRKAEELRLPIKARFVTTVVCGLAPRIMGIGPSIAIPLALEQAGLSKDEVDLFEINEAFASMYVYCVRHLGLDIDKVNVNGGAIALGHPLGATGARQVATGLAELERRGGRVLVTSMCIGLGMGAAAVFVRE
ncbi:thiolase [Dacryopinax primogenitus]|uniref:Thiolase n=1 Tax=Dacryopinax primogenitus (strain DJM 731) TaxID=1858805 RepID=M5G2Y9_DACPD|nr:thiolase [Dacryopinax primogenitus]EJU00192.1 thiolase [Dacryopinax primogenitus]